MAGKAAQARKDFLRRSARELHVKSIRTEIQFAGPLHPAGIRHMHLLKHARLLPGGKHPTTCESRQIHFAGGSILETQEKPEMRAWGCLSDSHSCVKLPWMRPIVQSLLI